jgi:hypothetical protein
MRGMFGLTDKKREKEVCLQRKRVRDREKERESEIRKKKSISVLRSNISVHVGIARGPLSLSFFLCPSPPFLRLFLTVSFITLLIRAFHQIKFNLAESFAVIRRT